MTLLQKILLPTGGVLIFVLGIALSDVILHTVNGIFGKEIFTTKIDLDAKLTESNDKLAELGKKLAQTREEYDDFVRETKTQQQQIDNLAQEIDTQIDPAVIKDALLTSPTAEADGVGKIFLNPKTGESLIKPTSSDDPTVARFKQTFNKKAQEIIDTSRGIMGQKIGQLDKEMVRMNDELKETNVELIKKLKEVEQYKKELDEHKKQIKSLEGVKLDLEKTVGVLETKIESGRLKVSFKGDILFTSGSHKLRQEGLDLLNSVYPILQKNTEKNDIFIAGHTDNVRVKSESGKYESNWDLSTYRAIEVVKHLISRGMDPMLLTAAGYGEHKPVTSNATAEGRAKNRRVELFLIPRIIKRQE